MPRERLHAYHLPMQYVLQRVVLGNSVQDWVLAALAFLLTFTVVPLLRGVVRSQASRYAKRDLPLAAALVLYLIQRTSGLFRLTVALYLAERVLTLPGRSDHYADIVIVWSFWLQVGLWLMAAVNFGLNRRMASGNDRQLAGTLNIVVFIAGLIVWTLVALMALRNLGVDITALVAGLGVGGIAIALALQNILGDLFASLSIALDKPFGVGDLLRVDDCEGTVEEIGIKSTRLRSVTGEQIILANADLLKSRVRNFERMQERRALFVLKVPHDTDAAKLEQVPSLVADAVAAWGGGARFVHCLLKNIGESALEFEVVFFVSSRKDVAVALDVVNRGVLERFRGAGIGWAVPMQRVQVVQA